MDCENSHLEVFLKKYAKIFKNTFEGVYLNKTADCRSTSSL